MTYTDNLLETTKVEKLDFNVVGAFSKLFLDYIKGKPELDNLYSHRPTIEGFGNILTERKFDTSRRIVLSEVLRSQYGPLEKSAKVEENIVALTKENTFTVTTGHQLNIFTGPLYFIYKIATVINACRKLKEHHPDYHFVPVYWMASEDHDFEEISSFHLFGKQYTWETSQTGPVGRFSPTSLNDIIEQLPESVPLFERAYLDHGTLADAVRFYTNELFGEHGLVVIDADHAQLKHVFKEIIKRDVIEQKADGLVQVANDQLVNLGYSSQAFSRQINFFYLENGTRERIIQEGDDFLINNTDRSFSKEEILDLIDSHPEHFSPNVIMRPLYQETILPNIGYTGGPAEVAYWLQLGEVFKHYETSFPILLPRNFGLMISKAVAKKIDKLDLEGIDLFKDSHSLKAKYLEDHDLNDHLLDKEKSTFLSFYDELAKKAGAIDKSLTGFIGAESAKAIKNLENIEKRLKKAQEGQNETAMTQIDTIKERLFPAGGLQERHDNFLNFYLNNPDFLHVLLDNFDPFDLRFHLMWE
ncbi:MAG: bacillithiol biosynthesis cysteine-adding enzyme BshC [Cyclobacteriaceae bacterium]|nr:bacillithiol biosynthesis cysteine-adding enzyme BshC [Cyclobacteriaceae bacterium HetDA_MAG_MS6]